MKRDEQILVDFGLFDQSLIRDFDVRQQVQPQSQAGTSQIRLQVGHFEYQIQGEPFLRPKILSGILNPVTGV